MLIILYSIGSEAMVTAIISTFVGNVLSSVFVLAISVLVKRYV